MVEQQYDAVVVGGGIGGLCAAIALRRVGRRVVVIEQEPTITAVGAGLTLFPNALRGLAALGLGQEVEAHGWVALGQGEGGLRRPSGRWLVKAHTIASIAGVRTFLRADLHALLRDALPAETLVLGTTVAQVRETTDGVRVQVRGPSGEQELTATFVIGADGARSAVRRSLWPEHPGLRYSGYTAWRGVATLAAPVRESSETWGRGERFGVVPLRERQVYWYATAGLPAGAVREVSPSAALDRLRDRFGGWHDPIPALLAATEPAQVLQHEINFLAPGLDSFTRGRVALLGDAAHAMTPDLGQGACQAIEDAAVLADCVRRNPDPATALARYDQERRGRAQRIARTALRVSRVAQAEHPVAAALRDGLMQLTPSRLARVGAARATAWTAPSLPSGTPG